MQLPIVSIEHRPYVTGPSVSSVYARALEMFFQTRGLPGLVDSSAPPPPGRRVDGYDFGRALVAGGEVLGDEAPGLTFGTHVGGAGFGLLGVISATARTLLMSIQHLSRYESLTSTLGRMIVRRSGGQVTMKWQPAAVVPPAVPEAIIAGWVSFGRYLLGQQVEVRRVRFAHPRVAALRHYEDGLAAPVEWDAQEHSLTIAEELLDAVPRFTDARLNAAMSGWLGCCVAGLTPGSVVTHRVASLLGDPVILWDANEEAIAHAMHMGRRTLQRRLAAEGTSFRHVLDSARAHQAIVELMRGSSSLVQLGANVGFSEQSSLCRAFRRWAGYAPLELRHRLSGVFCELPSASGDEAARLA